MNAFSSQIFYKYRWFYYYIDVDFIVFFKLVIAKTDLLKNFWRLDNFPLAYTVYDMWIMMK
jgi:hypothetical protein